MKALVLDGDFDPRPDYTVSETESRPALRAGAAMSGGTPVSKSNQVPDPEVGPEDVLIRIRACGV